MLFTKFQKAADGIATVAAIIAVCLMIIYIVLELILRSDTQFIKFCIVGFSVIVAIISTTLKVSGHSKSYFRPIVWFAITFCWVLNAILF